MDKEPLFITHCRDVIKAATAKQFTYVITNGLDQLPRRYHFNVTPLEATLAVQQYDGASEGGKEALAEAFATRPHRLVTALRKITTWRSVNVAAAMAEGADNAH